MDRKGGNDDDKRGRATKKPASSSSKSGSLRAGSAVAEYVSAAEAAAAAAAATAGPHSSRRRKILGASRTARRREAEERGIAEGAEDGNVFDDGKGVVSAQDGSSSPSPASSALGDAGSSNKIDPEPKGAAAVATARTARAGDSATLSSLEEKAAAEAADRKVRGGGADSSASGAAASVSLLDSKAAIAVRSAMRRAKGENAGAGPAGSAGSTPAPQAGTDGGADVGDGNSSGVTQEERSKSIRSIEFDGHGSFNVSEMDGSSTVKSRDASSGQGLDLEASGDVGGGRYSRRALVEAVLVDEDEIARRAYAKAASDVRQQMREMAVSAREVVAVPEQGEDLNAEPSSCWRRRRRLWIALIAVVVVASVVIGCVVGLSNPGTSDASSSETIISGTRPDGSPITFVSLSGLSGCPGATGSRRRRRVQTIRGRHLASEGRPACSASTLFAVEDSFADRTRVLSIDTSRSPAVVVAELVVTDPSGRVEEGLVARNYTGTNLINGDGTLKLDAEAVAALDDGGFWIASEGKGAVNSIEEPLRFPNFIVRIDGGGVVTDVVFLPDSVNAVQDGNGLEGLDVDGQHVVVAFQRPWLNETLNRIGIYNTDTQQWTFNLYAVDPPESPDGGWVGIADITHVGNGAFLVMERDSKDDDEARVKRIYKTQVNYEDNSTGLVLDKEFVVDILPIVQDAAGGLIPEKVEGMAFDGAGNLWIVTDNDGGDEETYLLKVPY